MDISHVTAGFNSLCFFLTLRSARLFFASPPFCTFLDRTPDSSTQTGSFSLFHVLRFFSFLLDLYIARFTAMPYEKFSFLHSFLSEQQFTFTLVPGLVSLDMPAITAPCLGFIFLVAHHRFHWTALSFVYAPRSRLPALTDSLLVHAHPDSADSLLLLWTAQVHLLRVFSFLFLFLSFWLLDCCAPVYKHRFTQVLPLRTLRLRHKHLSPLWDTAPLGFAGHTLSLCSCCVCVQHAFASLLSYRFSSLFWFFSRLRFAYCHFFLASLGSSPGRLTLVLSSGFMLYSAYCPPFHCRLDSILPDVRRLVLPAGTLFGWTFTYRFICSATFWDCTLQDFSRFWHNCTLSLTWLLFSISL